MKITENHRKEILERKKILEQAKENLKKEFIGLDDVIDELINHVEPWYLFPEGQVRPTIVNLWGLTGVGKTSLVNTLFRHIKCGENLYKFNVGDYSNRSSDSLSYVFTENLKTKEKTPVGIVFDEFQLGRTINEHGEEKEESGLRIIWDLLDSGKIEFIDTNWNVKRVHNLVFKLKYCQELGVEIKDGFVLKNYDFFKKIFSIEENEEKSKKKNKFEIPLNFIIPENFIYSITECFQELIPEAFISDEIFVEYISKIESINELIEWLEKHLKIIYKPKTLDYTQSIIFIIGNLDEAYSMTKEVSPDNDPDDYYKNSLDISLTDIKDSLKSRFRIEQIGRLGNNHIIYKAFSSQNYRDLISLELNKVKTKLSNRFEIEIDFDDSVNDIIYKEGVFPTQGTRPVFSTINSQIESTLSKVATDIALSGENVNGISWSFSQDKQKGDVGYHKIKFYIEKNECLFTKDYEVRLKLESLRKTIDNDRQVVHAVHESGHAIVGIFIFGIIPDYVLSRSANGSSIGGFVKFNGPEILLKETEINRIKVGLAGTIAEKLIFSDNLRSMGAESDIKKVSGIALSLAQKYGLLNEKVRIGVESIQTQYHTFKDTKLSEIDAKNLVIKCFDEVENLLREHMELLISMSKYLVENNKIVKEDIIKMLQDNNYDLNDLNIKNDIDKYYNLKNILYNKKSIN